MLQILLELQASVELEQLTILHDVHLTDRKLKKLLDIFGAKLRSLTLSQLHITGEGRSLEASTLKALFKALIIIQKLTEQKLNRLLDIFGVKLRSSHTLTTSYHWRKWVSKSTQLEGPFQSFYNTKID